jgi:hypothetical protein
MEKATVLAGLLAINTGLFAYYDQNTINDPFQQMNRNIQYNNMNQASMARKPSNELNFNTGNIQQPTYQQPTYNYSNSGSGYSGGGNSDVEDAMIIFGIPLLMLLLL